MYWWKHIPTSNISNHPTNKVRSQMINLVNYTGIGKKKHLMMLITLHISGCITIISLIEYRILFYLTDFSNDINKTVMFPLLLFFISFLFCSRYSGHNSAHNSALYMLVTRDTMWGLGGMFLILSYRFFYASIYQVRDGGGDVSYCLFIFMYQDYSKIFCIPMLHTTHGRLVVKLLHSDWCRKYFRD